jgi:putative DNA primase/helicase
MTKGKATTTRDYDIRFRRAEPADSPEETRRIRAANPEQAKRRLEVDPELRLVELIYVSCKAVAGSAREDEPEPPAEAGEPRPRNRIEELLDAAEVFTGDDQPPDAGDASPEPPDDLSGPLETGPVHLTRAEWKILRECALLDENDADNGKRLLKWFGDRILNILENGWHVWTGTHWDAEAGQHAIERLAHQVVARIKREAALIDFSKGQAELLAEAQRLREAHPDGKQLSVAELRTIKAADELEKELSRKRSQRFNFGVRSGDRSRTKAMIDQAEPHRTVLPAELDADDLAINCLNCTVRLHPVDDPDSDPDDPHRAMHWEAYRDDHDPDDLFTKVASVNYDPAAECPLFLGDLARFQPDPLQRDFLQVFMGYVMLGEAGEQVYGFFYGDGANWKSAFLQAIARTLGTYYKPMNYTSISGNNMPTGDKPSPDWARLSGVRFLSVEEVPRKEPIKEELVKLVTSGTPLPVRHLNKGMFDLITRFTCVMTSNAEPNISGHDNGIWRRTLIVPWDVIIPPAERLPFNVVMARYEPERPGIFNWLLAGALKYKEQGLQPFYTKRMREFTESVRADRDAAGSFIEDCVEHSEGEHVTAGDLYRAFVSYCHANGIDPILNSTAFGRQVKRVEVGGKTMERRKHKVQGVRRFNDIKLHDVPKVDDDMRGYGGMTR